MNDALLFIRTLCPAALMILFGLATLLRLPERKEYKVYPPAQKLDEPTTKGKKL